MATMNYLLFSAALALSVTIASCVMCHQCQTLASTECSDKFEETEMFLGECDDDNFCIKYKTIVWIRDSGYINGGARESSVVTRTCEPKGGEKQGCEGWQNNGGVTIKCRCGSDGCNAGHSITPKFLTASLGCLFVYVALHLFLRH